MTNEEKTANGMAVAAQKLLAAHGGVQRGVITLAHLEELRQNAVADLAQKVEQAILFRVVELDIPETLIDLAAEPIVQIIERFSLDLVGMGTAEIMATFKEKADA